MILINKEQKYFNLQEDGIELIVVKDSRIRYSMHNHTSSYLFGVLVSGDIIFMKGDEQYELSNGSNFYVEPYEMHAILPTSEYTLTTLVMPIDYFKSRSIDTINRNMQKLLERAIAIIPIENQSLISFKTWIQSGFNPNETEYMKFDEPIKNVIDWYTLHPEDSFTLDRIAKTTNFSAYHFLRIFKKQVGLPPHKFLIQHRIRKAQKILAYDIPLTEVALLTGFYDQSHFIRCFKNIVGILPSEYRKVLENGRNPLSY